MGFFDNILEKLGLRKNQKDQAASKPTFGSPGAGSKPREVQKDDRPLFAPKAISEVDVVAKLEALSKGKGLNWKVSIVELLTLLDIDSSKKARIELAKELGCPPDFIGGDYSKMNVWLHKEVLRKIAANGGNIPRELLD
jgi:hypothetical protein